MSERRRWTLVPVLLVAALVNLLSACGRSPPLPPLEQTPPSSTTAPEVEAPDPCSVEVLNCQGPHAATACAGRTLLFHVRTEAGCADGPGTAGGKLEWDATLGDLTLDVLDKEGQDAPSHPKDETFEGAGRVQHRRCAIAEPFLLRVTNLSEEDIPFTLEPHFFLHL